MAALAGTFGIAVPNFTAYPQMPDIKALVDYGIRMEQLGFDSLWVWDHILLGVDPNFPIIESLTLLTAIAARTSRIKLGTGILVNPALGGVGITDYTNITGNNAGTYDFVTQMIAQGKAVLATLVWSGVGSAILYKIVDIVIGLRPSVEEEREGLDITDHGERAYNM